MTMSNHLPFEDWLFAGEPLTLAENEALQAHLQECPACRERSDAWRDVQIRLRMAPELGPEPGFSTRWLARLAADRKIRDRRQTLLILLVSIGGAGLLLLLMAWLALPAFQSPAPLFWAGLYRLVAVVSFAGSAQDLIFTFFRTLGAVPVSWWILFVGILCELGVLWIVALRLLTLPRRVSL